MTAAPAILTAGRIYCDLVFSNLDAAPAMGREVFAGGLTVCTGGGAFITAAYLAALGEAAGLIGHLPADPFSQIARTDMAANRIEPFTLSTDGTDVQLTAAIVGDGDRAFVTRRVGTAVPQSLIDHLPPARHLHVGELTTAIEHPDLIDKARAAGMTISLDCGWDEAVFAHPLAAERIAAVDLFLPNRAEADALRAAGKMIAPRHLTIIKCGAEGASALAAGESVIHAPAQPADLVDTTGAGDAFNAGFISAWLAGASTHEALDLGNACGAQAVARLGGATDLPDLSGLHAAQMLTPTALHSTV